MLPTDPRAVTLKDDYAIKNRRDFSGTDMYREIDLADAWLPFIDCNHSNFDNSDFSRSHLAGMTGFCGSFAQTHFDNACLKGASMQGANLQGASFYQADLGLANLTSADLTNCYWVGAHLSDTNLSNTDLSHADLSQIDLSHANLSRTTLKQANFAQSILSGAVLVAADGYMADFRHADMTGATLRGVNFSGANLSDTNFSQTDLGDAIADNQTIIIPDGWNQMSGLSADDYKKQFQALWQNTQGAAKFVNQLSPEQQQLFDILTDRHHTVFVNIHADDTVVTNPQWQKNFRARPVTKHPPQHNTGP